MNSGENRGTTATIDLPAAKGTKKTKLQATASTTAASVNILVIDDEAMIRELFYEIFSRTGHTVTLSASSREGLQAFDEGTYDIVYTDLRMPEISGWEVASAIKKRKPSTVVIMVTGWGVQMDDEKVKENKIDSVISKPFQISQLRDSVTQAMETREKTRLRTAISSD